MSIKLLYRQSNRAWGIAGLCWLLLFTACANGQTGTTPRDGEEPTDEQVEKTVNDIDLIVGLPSKKGEEQWDEHALAITRLGKRAAPYLVEKITDTSTSKVGEGFRYTIGDVALALLNDIYEPPGWPFPDDSIKIPQKYGNFRDYVEFVETPDARRRLRESWRNYIEKHEPPRDSGN
jgi:hypothetical protein